MGTNKSNNCLSPYPWGAVANIVLANAYNLCNAISRRQKPRAQGYLLPERRHRAMGNFFFSFCTVIKQLAWADILKLVGILITCTSRYAVWTGRTRVSEGSALTSSFEPSSQFLPALSSHPATAAAVKLLFFTDICGEKISLDYAAKKP